MQLRHLPVFFVFIVAVGAVQGADRPFDVRDLVMLDRVSGPRLSPDGGKVIFTVRETDIEADKGVNSVWWMPATGGTLTRLTAVGSSASDPRWAPDGESVYFVSDRSESAQVWQQSIDDGEARQVTDYALDVGSYRFAPNGGALALTLQVFPDCGADFACTAGRQEEHEGDPATGMIFDQLFIRHWDSWKDGTRSQLFVATLGDDGRAQVQPVLVSRGIAGDVPSKPFGDASEYTFTPNSRTLIFAARTADREEAWSTNFDLYSAPADGSKAPVNLTADNEAMDSYPLVSHDGETLYYLAMKRPGLESDRRWIMAMALDTGVVREINPDWDRSAGPMVLSADGGNLFTAADDDGEHPLFAVDIETGETRRVLENGAVAGFDVSADAIVFARSTLQTPAGLFRTGLSGGDETRLTQSNADRLAGVSMGESTSFEFAGWNDERVRGFVVKPYGFEPGTQYPVALLIHGGPQGSWTDSFHYRWNVQTYSGQGFAVVVVDFHGSTGYGQQFTDSISGDWGGKPLVDLQKGLAAALEKFPWLDGSRVCALGASYGGYMVNWIAGKWQEPFRCLVNHDGLFDLRLMAYATEELWFTNAEFGGPQFEVPADHEKYNPINHVGGWTLPMLVIHGQLDYRVTLDQGIAPFTALQVLGIDSQFLYFPDENHWVLKPANSIQWHDTVNAWLKRWLVDAQAGEDGPR